MASRSWAKANNPYWSEHVETWFRGHQEAEAYCRRRKLSRATFEQWARHLVSAENLDKRAAQLQKIREKSANLKAEKLRPGRKQRPRRNRYSVRTDNGEVAVRAFWGMHVEAMNWSGMGFAEYAAALDLSPYALRIWRDRLADSGDAMDWRSLLHPSARAQLSSAANCARRKYRLTLEAADGRSDRRRFSEEQRREIVAETEKPGASVALICRRHGIATSMAFRWRMEFGLAGQMAPQLATVELGDGASGELPVLAALRNLVQPPDGMTAIDLDDGRRVFAPTGSNWTEVEREFARQSAKKGNAP